MPAMTDHRPTDEQEALLALLATPGHVMCNALAGCGKTATILLAEAKYKSLPLQYIVFNKRNADEAKAKFSEHKTVVNTLNGLGHRAWMKATGRKLVVKTKNNEKTGDILREIIKTVPKAEANALWAVFWDVCQGVALAKAYGYIPDGKYEHIKRLATREEFHAGLEEPPDDLIAALIDKVLFESIKQSYLGVIDFNDQPYMSALFGGVFPSFPEVAVDEFQDHNRVGHEIIAKMSKSGRLLGVGDPNQNIYGFRGAKHSGMADAIQRFSMRECTLSLSFRCPSAIVDHVKWHVPHFRAFKQGGHVEVLKTLDPDIIPDSAVILCRNNAPLFKMALQLLASQRSVSVAGSDIGPRIVSTMKKLGDEGMSRASLLDAIEDWREEKLARESKTAAEVADCMKVFASFGTTLGSAIAYAEHLFGQQGSIRLMTGHKAKGMEWDTVYHLDPWLGHDTEQDRNIRYVISTRSANELYEIDSKDIQW